MLQSALSCLRIFNLRPGDRDADILLLAIALHDRFKYGKLNNKIHTDRNHENLIADLVLERGADWFDDSEKNLLEFLVRWHSGRWSPVNKHKNNRVIFTPYLLMIHLLDVLSANRRLVRD